MALIRPELDCPTEGVGRLRSKPVDPRAMIHLRPTRELGAAIGHHASSWKTSRGEATKRLAVLAVQGLDVDFADTACVLAELRHDAHSFERACACIAVRIARVAAERGYSAEFPENKRARLRIAQELVDPYRFIADVEDEVEKQRRQVKLYLFR
jgi:hypothetical protein